MIRPAISPLHEAIFRPYIMRLMRRQFNAVRLLGDFSAMIDEPMLLLPNHSTWWDGFFVYLLKQTVFHRPLYLMMLEEQLRKNRFFARVGAYSIDPGSLRGNRASLRFTGELLASPQKPVVCIFPQGELLPWGVRPLGYKRGIELLLRQLVAPVRVMLAAVKCEYLAAQRAEVFIQLRDCGVYATGQPAALGDLAHRHETLLDELSARITAGEQGQLLLAGKRSINESFEALRKKVGLLREAK